MTYLKWTDELIATLRRLHAEGHSPSAIARRLHVTRGVVGGKLYRLGLTAPGGTQWTAVMDDTLRREHAAGTPLKTVADALGFTVEQIYNRVAYINLPPRRGKGVPRARRSTLKRLPSVTPQAGETQPAARDGLDVTETVAEAVASPVPKSAARTDRVCQWLNGEPGAWNFCESPVWRGSYCQAHYEKAFLKKV